MLNLEFRPTRVNVLVGPNNAGKTNLCHALSFLSRTTSCALDEAASLVLGENWNITNAYVASNLIEFEVEMATSDQGHQYSYEYSLHLAAERETLTGKQMLRMVRERLLVNGSDLEQAVLIENDNGKARILDEKTQRNGNPPVLETEVPREFSALCKLFDMSANQRAVIFKQRLGFSHYYNLVPQMLRSAKIIANNPTVSPDGTNFSRFLYTLHNQQPRLERKIIDALKIVEPKIDFFKFFSPDPDFIHFLLEDSQSHPFSTQSMSDGTLRFLALCCHVALMDELSGTEGTLPLILFEEPENGIYVGHLKSLFSRLDFKHGSGQCVFTSHSPYFIDLFDQHLEGVHVMKPGLPSAILSKLKIEKVRPLLDDMALGDLHFHEMLA